MYLQKDLVDRYYVIQYWQKVESIRGVRFLNKYIICI